MKIIHVAAVELSTSTGMGRIAIEWKNGFERAGHFFLHIGPKEVGNYYHSLLFGWFVRRYIKKSDLSPDLILAHEPVSGFLKFKKIPLMVFSHGIEKRDWEEKIFFKYDTISIKAHFLPPVLRFFSNSIGFKKASAILVSNATDKAYLEKRYPKQKNKIYIFKNGIYHLEASNSNNKNTNSIIILFNGSWINRKGIKIIQESCNKLLKAFPNIILRIAGGGFDENYIKSFFDAKIHGQIQIIGKFDNVNEYKIYTDAKIFILASYFEGQSLALAQAMYMGLCPIVSDNSGQLDLVKDEFNGLVFKTGSSAELLHKLERLIHTPELISKFANNAHREVKFDTWEKVSEELVQHVVSVISNE
jgi:glycosyltransferase involved in cell wall biosynthesis